MHPTQHPNSCSTCIAAGETCTWDIVDSQLLRYRTACDRCDVHGFKCDWTTPPPPPKEKPVSSSTTYVKGDNETEEQRFARIKSWVCKPDKPSDPQLRACWIADLRIWNNGGNIPLPPQVPTPTPSASVKPEPPKPSRAPTPPSPAPSIINLDPPSPPAISVDCTQPPPPKKPRNFIHKTGSKNQTKLKNKTKNQSFKHPNFKTSTRKPSPIIIPDSPIEVKHNYSTTVEDLIETPPPSPSNKFDNTYPSTPIQTDNLTSEPIPSTSNLNDSTSTSNLNDSFIPVTYPTITREGIDAFEAEFGSAYTNIWFMRKLSQAEEFMQVGGMPNSISPRDPTIALTETIFNLLSTHWDVFPSRDPVEFNSRLNLVRSIKNIVALDVVYRAHPCPDLRPPHYDGITTGFPPYFPIPPVGHEKFYDEVSKDNVKCSAEEKGKKRARE